MRTVSTLQKHRVASNRNSYSPNTLFIGKIVGENMGDYKVRVEKSLDIISHKKLYVKEVKKNNNILTWYSALQFGQRLVSHETFVSVV